MQSQSLGEPGSAREPSPLCLSPILLRQVGFILRPTPSSPLRVVTYSGGVGGRGMPWCLSVKPTECREIGAVDRWTHHGKSQCWVKWGGRRTGEVGDQRRGPWSLRVTHALSLCS